MADDKKVRVGCGVMIKRGDKILLGHRNTDAEKASSALHGEGTWTMPGGKLDFGETPIEGVSREALEETGLKLSKNSLKLISVTNDMVPDAHFITLGFMSEVLEGEPAVMEPDEITEWKWFDINSLPTPMYPSSQKIVNNFLAGRFYSD